MGLIFKSDFHDEFGTWPLAYIPYGGADFGEIQAIGNAVGDGDDSAFYGAWVAAAGELASDAAIAFDKGHQRSARDLFLRASCFYAASYHPIYGAPVDPRLKDAFRKQIDVFNKGLSLVQPAITPLRIPFEQTAMPAYLIPAEGHTNEIRPLIIFTNGYDGTVTDMYFASAVAASRRGYHTLIFDGPGQGEMLYENGVHLRPDWETVIKAVVDFALTLPNIDPQRIALSGWSLGGYLASRAAAFEHRLAACIADPGSWGIAPGFRQMAIKLGASSEGVKQLGAVDESILAKFEKIIAGDRRMRWTIIQRGFWVHGVNNLRDYLKSVDAFTLEGLAENIRCPTLLTAAENDTLGAGAQSLFDTLRCPKTLIKFTAAEGAGTHCEMLNRSLLNRRTLDWLDEIFGVK